MRKHLVKSAEFWFNSANKFGRHAGEALLSMENAYNHVENALAYILEKSPEAKRIFDELQPPLHTQPGHDETDCPCKDCHELNK